MTAALHRHFEAATPLVPVGHQPAVVADQLASLDLDPAEALRAAGLPAGLFDEPLCLLSPADYLRLLHAAAQAIGGREAAFVLGPALLPGHFGAASHALLRAPTLRRALAVLVANPARLSPLLAAHCVVEERMGALVWTDTGAGAASAAGRPFLVELHMSAVASMCDWLAGMRLPWRYCFNRTPPRTTDAHEAHLGSRLHFGCQLDAMLIEPEWLDRPWANPRASAAPALQQALDRQAEAEDDRHALLARLYRHLLANLRASPGVETTAEAFGISAATLKRRLGAHGTHFQAELDQVRTHVALQLMHGRGWSTEAISAHLGFHDAANFRRSLKRWTGLTPGGLRASLS